MTEFLNIKEKALLEAKEIMLTCNASIRFNPYKGFYPAERTIELSTLFSQSYGHQNAYVYDTQYSPAEQLKKAAFRIAVEPIMAPGILFNTIKSVRFNSFNSINGRSVR